MSFNFATASVTAAQNKDRLDAVQKDLMEILDNGGVTRLGWEDKWRGEMAALVREAVIDEFRMTDPTPIFTERRTGNQGDTYEYEKLVNTLRSVEYSPNSMPQIFTPRKTKWTIKTSQYEFAYGIDLQKIMSRQYTVGDFATMLRQALQRHYQNLVLTAINAGCGSGVVDARGRAVRTAAAGSSVIKAELDAAIRRMTSSNGSGVTIFGMRYALDPIFDIAATASGDLTKDALNDRGVIGTYRGARLVEMQDDYNEFYQAWGTASGIDLEKLLFISSGSPGAILLEKDMSALTWERLNPEKANWASGIRLDQGILVHTPAKYHVIQLA
jgi:hypothetical protein